MLMRWLVAVALLPAFAAEADSLFLRADAKTDGPLISVPTEQYKVGDIITVLVRESVEASTSAETSTRKQSEVESEADAGDNAFLVDDENGGLNIFNPGELPNWGIETDNESRTNGETTRTNTLTTTLTCTVVQTLPGGLLRLQGKKRVKVNREDSYLRVSGVVRAEDISPDNTVPSTLLADATVDLDGKGPLWNNQRRGLITRFLDWFAPY